MSLKNRLYVFLLFIGFIVAPQFILASTYYVAPTGSDSSSADGSSAKPWATFAKAYTKMLGGDTLIAKNGTYPIPAPILLDRYTMPPSGSSTTYTIVKAETDGGVILDGNDKTDPMRIDGSPIHPMQYVQIQGFVMRHQATGALIYSNDGSIHHVKFVNDGFENAADGNNVVFGLTSGSGNLGAIHDILVEGCFAWGSGRYKFSSYYANKIIFRRCVARFDRADPRDSSTQTEPIAVFADYSSTNVQYQNCISIDGDHPEFWLKNEGEWGAFFAPTTSGSSPNFSVIGSIGLNMGMGMIGTDWGADNAQVIDSVGWNLNEGAWLRDGPTFDHCTFGNLHGPAVQTQHTGLDYYPGGNGNPVAPTITNSIIQNVTGTALTSFSSEDYNVLYGNTTKYSGTPAGAHTSSQNPGLLYITRIESNNGLLHTTAKDGGDRGANILYQYGVSGTLWGDPGYNTLTTTPLWPFPNEAIIQQFMKSYSYTGTTTSGQTATLSGNRGFCADPNGLTDYIWTYLGNPNPYGGPPDTTPPIGPSSLTLNPTSSSQLNASWPAASDNIGVTGYKITVSLNSDFSNSLASYTNKDVGNVLNIAITGLLPSTIYYVKVIAYDFPGNISGGATKSATTLAPSAPAAPIGLNAIGANQTVNLTWTPNTEPDLAGYTVFRSLSSAGPYTAMNSLLITQTSYSDSGLTNGTTYWYTIEAQNVSGLTSSPSTAASGTPSPISPIGQSGTGYRWFSMTSATANTNKTQASGINDGNTTTDINLLGTGTESNSKTWEGAGIQWSTTQNISQVTWINGSLDGNGDGVFDAGFDLQFTQDGTTWVHATGWTLAPAYDYNSINAQGKSYVWTGPNTSAIGLRCVGQVHVATNGNDSWVENVREIQVIGSIGGTGVGDTTPPTISITSPNNGSTVSGIINVSATATDNVRVSHVDFTVDGAFVTTIPQAPYTFSWNTTVLTNTSHTILANAYDPSGNQAAFSISVTVNNPLPTQPPLIPVAPQLNLSSAVELTQPLTISNANAYSGSVTLNWSFTSKDASSTGGSPSYGLRSGSVSLPINASVPGFTIVPQNLGLSVGTYTYSVTATVNGQTSTPTQGQVSFVGNDLDSARVYPNPWRSDQHTSSITFDNLSMNSHIKIFTLSGHFIKALDASGGLAQWNITTGDQVASGIYIYLITNDQGQKIKGKLAIIR